jgi:sigma-B regulation protein RsbQ
MQARSADGTELHYDVTGTSDTALVFVHGWMGNGTWWDAQRDAFAGAYRVVTIDLAGHGRSAVRATPTAEAYAADIVAVINAVAAPRTILVGHSMSGAYALLAAPQLPSVVAVILIDTVKNLDAQPPPEQVSSMLAMYRVDYAASVRDVLPKFLFAPRTPAKVASRLRHEFLQTTGDNAAALLEPLYRCDLRDAARHVRVPVRGIGTDASPSDVAANRRYFTDYDYVSLAGYGHYPMLEAPHEFNDLLRAQLTAL